MSGLVSKSEDHRLNGYRKHTYASIIIYNNGNLDL